MRINIFRGMFSKFLTNYRLRSIFHFPAVIFTPPLTGKNFLSFLVILYVPDAFSFGFVCDTILYK